MCEDFDSASGHVILDQETLEQLEADVNSVHSVSIWISFDSVDEESEGAVTIETDDDDAVCFEYQTCVSEFSCCHIQDDDVNDDTSYNTEDSHEDETQDEKEEETVLDTCRKGQSYKVDRSEFLEAITCLRQEIDGDLRGQASSSQYAWDEEDKIFYNSCLYASLFNCKLHCHKLERSLTINVSDYVIEEDDEDEEDEGDEQDSNETSHE